MDLKPSLNLGHSQRALGDEQWWDDEATWAYQAGFLPNGRAMRDGEPLASLSDLLSGAGHLFMEWSYGF